MAIGGHEIPELDRGGLRRFGITTGVIVAVLFGALIPWAFSLNYPYWPWVLFGVLLVWAVIAPGTLKPVYTIWMRFGLIMSKITTPIILTAAYFVALFPTSLIMRIFRSDPLSRKFDPDAASYRVEKSSPPKDHLERPF